MAAIKSIGRGTAAASRRKSRVRANQSNQSERIEADVKWAVFLPLWPLRQPMDK